MERKGSENIVDTKGSKRVVPTVMKTASPVMVKSNVNLTTVQTGEGREVVRESSESFDSFTEGLKVVKVGNSVRLTRVTFGPSSHSPFIRSTVLPTHTSRSHLTLYFFTQPCIAPHLHQQLSSAL